MFYPLAQRSIDRVSFLIHRTHGICLVVLLKVRLRSQFSKKGIWISSLSSQTLYIEFTIPRGTSLVYVLCSVIYALTSIGIILKTRTTNVCSCSQNMPETVEHFLIFCPRYNLIRSQLFEKLKKVISLITLISPSYTTNLFLYGNSTVDFCTELDNSLIYFSKLFNFSCDE